MAFIIKLHIKLLINLELTTDIQFSFSKLSTLSDGGAFMPTF